MMIDQLLASIARRTDPEAHRDRAFLTLLWDRAFRIKDVHPLDTEDIDLDRGIVRIRDRVNRVIRFHPIEAGTRTTLEQWIHHRRDVVGALFTTIAPEGKIPRRLAPRDLKIILLGCASEARLSIKPNDYRRAALVEFIRSRRSPATCEPERIEPVKKPRLDIRRI